MNQPKGFDRGHTGLFYVVNTTTKYMSLPRLPGVDKILSQLHAMSAKYFATCGLNR